MEITYSTVVTHKYRIGDYVELLNGKQAKQYGEVQAMRVLQNPLGKVTVEYRVELIQDNSVTQKMFMVTEDQIQLWEPKKEKRIKGLNELAQEINKWAQEKGWNDTLRHDISSFAEQLMNIHAEITKAWEELRKGKEVSTYHVQDKNGHMKPEGFPSELADATIRILHTCAFYGIDIDAKIAEKMEYNHKREYRHGGKLA